MAQDIRKLFKEEREKKIFRMKKGHEDRFLERLEDTMPVERKKGHYQWLAIAASFAIVLGIGSYFFLQKDDSPVKTTTVTNIDENQVNNKGISLGDLSPDLQKLENYYTTNINLELASLEVSDESKELVDGYMEQLSELGKEYNVLIEELNEVGPNDQTIEALIKNFQLQLTLLQKLKTKLNQFKSSKNEQKTNII